MAGLLGLLDFRLLGLLCLLHFGLLGAGYHRHTGCGRRDGVMRQVVFDASLGRRGIGAQGEQGGDGQGDDVSFHDGVLRG